MTVRSSGLVLNSEDLSKRNDTAAVPPFSLFTIHDLDRASVIPIGLVTAYLSSNMGPHDLV